jgi:uncharacterized surface protein with fasciclin (FAS1) repeats
MQIRKFMTALAMTALAITTVGTAQDKRVGDIIRTDARFSTFAKAIDAAGLENLLAGGNAVTVLAPTNEAFAKLPPGKLDSLLKPENKSELEALLKRHLVAGSLDQYALKRERQLDTVGGEKLDVKLVGGSLRVADARVMGRQGVAVNGTVQPLDAVITK